LSRSDHERETSLDAAGQSPRNVDPSVKVAGLAIAWIGGVACGWRVYHQSNLFDAVIRGAGAWLALMLLWLAALAFCQRFVLSLQAPNTGPDGTGRGLNPADGQAEP
jgi:hypothetical protein